MRILRGLNESGGDIRELIEGIVKALRAVWGVECALAGVAAVANFWMKGYNLVGRGRAEELKEGVDGS